MTHAPPVAVRMTRLDTVEIRPVTWLWTGRIPRGKLAILEGDPGLGKSTLTIELAARVSRGHPLPDEGPTAPADVVFLTFEDGLEDTIVPRLHAAGADLARCHALSGISCNGGPERLLSIPQDIPAVRAKLDEVGAALLVIDPLSAALSAATDTYKDADTRQALAPLARMAEETGVAVLIVRHLNKGAASRAIAAGGGSIGFAAAARAVLAVHPDPGDPSARVLAVVKCNIAPIAPSLSFGLVDAGEGWAHVEWRGRSEHSAEALNLARLGSPMAADAESEADTWLRGLLTDGARERQEVLRLAKDRGFPERTIERAARRLGVQRDTSGFGADRKSIWTLPGIAATPSPLGGNGSYGRNGGYGGVAHPAPERPRRTIERDGVPVDQVGLPTAHGTRWVDVAGEAA